MAAPASPVTQFHTSKWLWIVLAVSLVVIYGSLYGCPVAVPQGGAEASVPMQGPFFKELNIPDGFPAFRVPEGEHHFQLKLTKSWSGKIFLPPGHEFRIDAHCADIRFHTGKIVVVRPDVPVDVGIHLRNSIFQIRGEGIADIYVQRRSVQ